MRMPAAQQSVRPPPQKISGASLAGPREDEEPVTDQLEFEARLKALKAAADEKKAAVASTSASVEGPLSMPSYENPPPLTSTLFGEQAAADASGTFGPPQVGIAVASLALVVVFLVTSGGSDLGYASKRQASSQATSPQLAAEQRADVQSRLNDVEARLASNAGDLEALEEAAVLHARLGEYSTAAGQLDKLTAAKPSDVDAWRLLGETRMAAGEGSKAVAAYRKAWSASGQGSLEVLTGLTGTLLSEGQEAAAVDVVRAALDSTESKEKVGEVELGLLLAKVYSQWRGHAPDALAQYDALAEAHPDDFRPPLGKGLLLREQGREGDAQRYLIQAKYLAPPSSKKAVEALSKKQ